MLSSTPSTSNPKKSRGRPVPEDDNKSKKSRVSHAGSQQSIFSFFTTKQSKYQDAVVRRLQEQEEEFNELTLEDFTCVFDEEEDFDDYHAGLGGADSDDDDDDDDMQGRQEVEAEKVFYSKMPTVVTLTEEMSGGFWNASQTNNLTERAPSEVHPRPLPCNPTWCETRPTKTTCDSWLRGVHCASSPPSTLCVVRVWAIRS